MRTVKSLSLVAALLIGLATAAFSQETTQVIESVDFKITGATSEGALRNFLSISPGLREGLEFPSREALSSFLEQKRKDLVNDRVFKSVKLEDVAGETAGGKTLHAVTIEVVDAFSIFPLPYPSYDSNSGLLLGVETHYDNALGTMTNWYLDSYLVIRERDGKSGVGKWRIHPKISNLVLAGLPLTLDCLFDHKENQNISDDTLLADWACYRASADLSTKFNFQNDWYYKPELVAYSNFGFVDYLGNGDFNRDVLGLSATNTVGFGRVDWIGNFRKGFDANAYGTVSGLDRNDQFGVTGELGASASWYLPWKIVDYYGRFHAQYSLNDAPTGLGSWLRGVKDSTMSGVAAAFLNQSLAIDVLPLKGILDLQLHPFVDAGVALPASGAFDFSSDLRIGAGADVALFIDAISNFLIRCTVGMDLGYAKPWDHMEIILNTGLSY
jgi:hypothetical protein